MSGSVLIPISVLPTHVQFHFSCFKSRYRADMVSPLSDTEISEMLSEIDVNLTTSTYTFEFQPPEGVNLALGGCLVA